MFEHTVLIPLIGICLVESSDSYVVCSVLFNHGDNFLSLWWRCERHTDGRFEQNSRKARTATAFLGVRRRASTRFAAEWTAPRLVLATLLSLVRQNAQPTCAHCSLWEIRRDELFDPGADCRFRDVLFHYSFGSGVLL